MRIEKSYTIYMSTEQFNEVNSIIENDVNYTYMIIKNPEYADEAISLTINESELENAIELLEHERYIQEYEEYNSSAATRLNRIIVDIKEETEI